MSVEPLHVEGVAGPLVVTVNAFTGRRSMTVDGHAVQTSGWGRFAVPTSDGQTVDATVRSSWFDPYPTVEIAGVKHRTGPAVSVALRVLMVLPIALAFVGALVGAVFGFAGFLANLVIVRGSLETGVKAVLMIVVLAVAAVAWLVVASAIRAGVS